MAGRARALLAVGAKDLEVGVEDQPRIRPAYRAWVGKDRSRCPRSRTIQRGQTTQLARHHASRLRPIRTELGCALVASRH
eukprot:3605480-Prymnesium_polylepis.1